MAYVYYNFLIIIVLFIQNSVLQEYGWLSGDSFANSASNKSYPGARSGSSVWQDATGNVWLFAGLGFPEGANLSDPVPLNDLWRYSVGENKWTLVHPGYVTVPVEPLASPSPRYLSMACGVTDVIFVVYGGFGSPGVSKGDTWIYYFAEKKWLSLNSFGNSSLDNVTILKPTARGDAAVWCLHDRMYIFGGTDHTNSICKDLWKFSLKSLQWIDISKSITGAVPSGRNGATTWVIQDQDLYMFGGNIIVQKDSFVPTALGYTSDMWKFYPDNLTWQLHSGSENPGLPAVFGQSDVNKPGCRRRAVSWVDTSGNLWMFGGEGTDARHPSPYHSAELLSDLWRYHVASNTWAWMGGSQEGNAPSVFNNPGMMSGMTMPGSRRDAVGWVGKRNHFFLFSGMGWDNTTKVGFLNDLWVLDLSMLVGYHTAIPAEYVFLLLFAALGLTLALVITSIYARDRKGSSRWGGRSDYTTKYSQLGDGLD